MTPAKYDVLGIGNAIFDVLVQTDEAFLAAHGMSKGGMALIDEVRATAIYRDMGPATEMSGGSAANTIVGLANFGARTAYVGKVKDDQIGRLYVHDIRAAGVAFETRPANDGPTDSLRDRQTLTPRPERRRYHQMSTPAPRRDKCSWCARRPAPPKCRSSRSRAHRPPAGSRRQPPLHDYHEHKPGRPGRPCPSRQKRPPRRS